MPGEDGISSPLFTSSSLILIEFVGDFLSCHRHFLWQSVFRKTRKIIIAPLIICDSISVFPSKCLKERTLKPRSKPVWHVFILNNQQQPCIKCERRLAKEISRIPVVRRFARPFTFYTDRSLTFAKIGRNALFIKVIKPTGHCGLEINPMVECRHN